MIFINKSTFYSIPIVIFCGVLAFIVFFLLSNYWFGQHYDDDVILTVKSANEREFLFISTPFHINNDRFKEEKEGESPVPESPEPDEDPEEKKEDQKSNGDDRSDDPPQNSTFELNKSGEGQTAYLTFDDGPTEHTLEILSILDKHNVQATFFVNGREDDFSKGVYQEIFDAGHAIGNHTFSHDYDYLYADREQFAKDVERLDDLLYEVLGDRPRIFRFPGGSNSDVANQAGGSTIMGEVKDYIEEQGYVYFDWNVDSHDSRQINQSEEVIVKQTLKGIDREYDPNVLFHDGPNKQSTVDAFERILPKMESAGYDFDILTTDTSDPHQFLH